jgi:hypothetical protein
MPRAIFATILLSEFAPLLSAHIATITPKITITGPAKSCIDRSIAVMFISTQFPLITVI